MTHFGSGEVPLIGGQGLRPIGSRTGTGARPARTYAMGGAGLEPAATCV
jgi:hypothetical protein